MDGAGGLIGVPGMPERMPRSFPLRRALLCAAILAQTSGCFLVGPRYLGHDWGSASTQTQTGFHLPLGLRSGEDVEQGTWAALFEFFSAVDGKGSGVSEISGGVWIPLWAEGKWTWPHLGNDLDPITMSYLAAGMTYVHAYLDDGTALDEDGCLGAFVKWGFWHTVCRFLGVGAELRWTFGTGMTLHGRRMDADGVQLLFQIGLSHLLP